MYKFRILTRVFRETRSGIELGFLSIIELAYRAIVPHNARIDFTLRTSYLVSVFVDECWHRR